MKEERDLLIGCDVGTGGSKCVLADPEGRIMESTFETYGVSRPRPGWAEQKPEDWWRAVTEGIRRILASSGSDPAEVAGIGFAGQMIGIIPVDRRGKPLRPAIIWLDSRADRQAARMVRRLGGKRLIGLVAGAVPSGKDVVCKLAWLRENEPELFEETYLFLDTTGYLVFRATGEMIIDQTGAAGTGLLSNSTREWSRLLARLTEMPLEKMPPLRRCIDIAGGLTERAAAETGLEPGTPVIAGMADIPAAATGSGALEDGDAHVYLGTSSWVCLSLSRPRNIPRIGMLSIASPDPEMFVMLGESETAGACLDWFARNLAGEGKGCGGGEDAYHRLNEIAASVEPGSEGLIFAPWMYGERTPVNDTTLRAAFLNLSLEHRRDHMLRAVYEGVAFNIRWVLEEVEREGYPCTTVRAIGGGARSDLWMQVVADVTSRRVEATENPQEAGALGCALAVSVALGNCPGYVDIKNKVRVRSTYEPRNENSDTYDRLFKAYRSAYPALSKLGRNLNS